MQQPTSEDNTRLPRAFFSPGVLGAVLFTGLYLSTAIIVAALTGNLEFVFYIAVMLLLFGTIAWVHRTIGLSTGVLWALSFWGLAHMAGGLVPVPEDWPVDGPHAVLYSLWLLDGASTGGLFALKYDQLVHAYGFGVTTWLCWECLRAVIGRNIVTASRIPSERGVRDKVRPTLGILVFCVAGGMGFGALNELVEFTATRLTTTNVGGYENTGWDLVSNAVGCLLAAALIRWSGGRSREAARR